MVVPWCQCNIDCRIGEAEVRSYGTRWAQLVLAPERSVLKFLLDCRGKQ